jgi:glycerophosphoryl diester phosphodiesterase
VVAALHARGYAASAPFGSAEWQRQPVFIQSYEVSSLQRFAALTRVPLTLLMEPSGDPDSGLSLEQMTTDGFLARLSHYVTVVAPSKGALVRSAEAPAAAAAGGGQTGQGTSSIGVSRVVLESGRFLSSHTDVAAPSAGGRRLKQQQQHSVLQSTGLAEQLHRHGFQVHTYTVRDEPRFVLPVCEGVVACELQLLFDAAHLDGGFADYPGTMVAHFQGERS